MMKYVVCGSRSCTDYFLVEENLSKLQKAIGITHIVSGGARGADHLGEMFAKKSGISLTIVPAEWTKYGKSAGYKRNEDMLEMSDGVIAFWDGVSRGTKHMIDIARKANKPCYIIKTKEQ